MYQSQPELFQHLKEHFDHQGMILDEGQFVDNTGSLRTQAMFEIKTKIHWVLSATPYQHKVERLFSIFNLFDPERFQNLIAFKELYTNNPLGLSALSSELDTLMLRRKLEETTPYFQPETSQSFQKQLEQTHRIPHKGIHIMKTPLTQEQMDMIAWIINDFPSWGKHYRSDEKSEEDLQKQGTDVFAKIHAIREVMYVPENLGLMPNNLGFLDQAIAKDIEEGKKLVLVVWNRSLLHKIAKRYEAYGLHTIFGSTLPKAAEKAIKAFHEDPKTSILVLNHASGGVGLNLKAANSMYILQYPESYPALAQLEGRIVRTLGPEDLPYAKERVLIHRVVPYYPEKLIANYPVALQKVFRSGTIIEQLMRCFEAGAYVFQLVMDGGFGNMDEVEMAFKQSLFASLSLENPLPPSESSFTARIQSKKMRRLAESSQHFLGLYQKHKKDPLIQDLLFELIEQYQFYPDDAQQVAKVLAQIVDQGELIGELSFVLSVFEQKNKYIRERYLKELPAIMDKLYQQGKRAHKLSAEYDRLTPTLFLANLLLEGLSENSFLLNLSSELNEMDSSPLKSRIEEHLQMAMLFLLKRKDEAWLAPVMTRLASASLIDKVSYLYRLSLLSEFHAEQFSLWSEASLKTEKGIEGLLEDIDRHLKTSINAYFNLEPSSVDAMFQRNPHWKGNIAPLVAWLLRMRELNDPHVEAQIEEVVGSVFREDYAVSRLYANYQQGQPLDYLADKPDFWEAYSQNHLSLIEERLVRPDKVRISVQSQLIQLLGDITSDKYSLLEREEFRKAYDSFRKKGAQGRTALLEENIKRRKQLGEVLAALAKEEELNAEQKKMLISLNIDIQEPSYELKQTVRRYKGELDRLHDLFILERVGVSKTVLEDHAFYKKLLEALGRTAKYYRTRQQTSLTDGLSDVVRKLKLLRNETEVYQNLVIEDTSNPAYFINMGALSPGMINCFNPNGNPHFNRYILTALASRPLKLIMVRNEKGQIIAHAMMKVKKLEDGRPVLFLEKGLSEGGYDFRLEMSAFMEEKARLIESSTGMKIEVRIQRPDNRTIESDEQVYGTGLYTSDEYVEALFGWRRVGSYHHLARKFSLPKTEKLDVRLLSILNDQEVWRNASQIIGIGTSNRSIDDYIARLKSQGVRTVVDIRANPVSRYYPHFNQKSFEVSLDANGITYVWLGDTLGNPKDSKGERSMEGFEIYRKQDNRYKQGLQLLHQHLSRLPTNARLALTCAEGSEKACHRRKVLDDVRQSLIDVSCQSLRPVQK